jgi:catechol 2,3-dioxygenase-like lactoylglutathione lyase family enzyme
MLDHVSIHVQDFRRALAFYRAALAPLGYKVVMEFPEVAGLGEKGKPDFWIGRTDKPVNPVHVAFAASRQAVTAFHAAAVAAGGVDNGPPGLRPDYHPNYYGAFVLDPDGNNLEAVCHVAPGPVRKPTRKRVVARARQAVKRAASKLASTKRAGRR